MEKIKRGMDVFLSIKKSGIVLMPNYTIKFYVKAINIRDNRSILY